MANSIVRHRVDNPNLLKYASKNRNEGFFNDLTIIAGNENISANRLVLSCYSKYFEGMFKSILRHERVIEIRAVGGATIKALIDFIYLGFININDENVMTLLSGAEYLQLNEVQQFCFDFLERNEIVLDNSLDILKAVSKHEKSTLRNKLKKYISANLIKLSQTEKFKALSKQDLISCISILDRLQAKEASIYQAVVTWTRHNKEVRAIEFSELFKMLNLERMAIDFMQKTILNESLVLTHTECRKQTLSVYRDLARREKSEHSESHLISLGGEYTQLSVTVVFNLSKETQKTYPNFVTKLFWYCTLKLEDCVYTKGGSRKNELGFKKNGEKKVGLSPPFEKMKILLDDDYGLDVVLKLNLKEMHVKWKNIVSGKYRKCFVSANVFRNTLFVAGGENEYFNLTKSSEYYVPALNKWVIGPPLIHRRANHCLVSCNGFLYALGGRGEDEYLSSVEMLNDLNGEWQDVNPMQTPRAKFAAVNCNGVMYAVGGSKEDYLSEWTLISVEKYNFDTNRWEYVADMNIARYRHAACVLRGRIYVVGGVGTDGKVVKEIECYDPETNIWSTVGNVTDDLVYHTLVAV